MHNRQVGNIAVSEYHLVDVMVLDQFFEVIFRINGNTMRIARAAKCGWVVSLSNARNLSGSEGTNLIVSIFAEVGIKGVEISSRSSHDHNALSSHSVSSFPPTLLWERSASRGRFSVVDTSPIIARPGLEAPCRY